MKQFDITDEDNLSRYIEGYVVADVSNILRWNKSHMGDWMCLERDYSNVIKGSFE